MQIWANFDDSAETPPSNENGKTASNGKAPEARKEYIDVLVTEVATDGTTFAVQSLGSGTAALEKMMAEFSLHHKGGAAAADYTPKTGDQCSGQFTVDNQWYRAKIRKVDHANKTVDVVYLDYGNVSRKCCVIE